MDFELVGDITDVETIAAGHGIRDCRVSCSSTATCVRDTPSSSALNSAPEARRGRPSPSVTRARRSTSPWLASSRLRSAQSSGKPPERQLRGELVPAAHFETLHDEPEVLRQGVRGEFLLVVQILLNDQALRKYPYQGPGSLRRWVQTAGVSEVIGASPAHFPGWVPSGPASSAPWTRRAADISAVSALDEGSTALRV